MKQAADLDQSFPQGRTASSTSARGDERETQPRTTIRGLLTGDVAAVQSLADPLRAVMAAPGDPLSLESLRRAVSAQARRARALGRPAHATIGAVQQLLSELSATQPASREIEALLLWRAIRWVESEYS